MNTNTNLVGIEGGGGIFQSQGGAGGQKKIGEENRHFESWRGEKIDPLARIYTPAYLLNVKQIFLTGEK